MSSPGWVQGHQNQEKALRLTDPPFRASDQNPAFSADGTRLIFTRFENGYNEGPSRILLLDLDSGEITLLAAAPDSDNVNLPGSSWNALTHLITFSSDRVDAEEIWTMNDDGSNLRRVTHHDETEGYFIEPSFSPDGQWIVFEFDDNSPEEDQRGSIWKIRVDGSDLTALTNNPEFDDRQPNWSPTDSRILFQRREPGTDNWDIYTMKPDGRDIRQVTTAASSDTDASWSPDGQWIVYSSDYGDLETANLFVIAADGDDPIPVSQDSADYAGAPSWSPDGLWIAFEAGDEEASTAIWIIPAPTLP